MLAAACGSVAHAAERNGEVTLYLEYSTSIMWYFLVCELYPLPIYYYYYFGVYFCSHAVTNNCNSGRNLLWLIKKVKATALREVSSSWRKWTRQQSYLAPGKECTHMAEMVKMY